MIRCMLGIHKYETVALTQISMCMESWLFGTREENVEGVAKIQECIHCKKRKGIITNGITHQEFDHEVMLAQSASLREQCARSKEKQ